MDLAICYLRQFQKTKILGSGGVKNMKRRAIVTGGAGFIGCHLTRRLLDEGWSVLVIDNLSSGYFHNIPAQAEFKWLDLSDEASAEQLPKDPVDVVFHLASHVGQQLSFEQPVLDLKTNAIATMILLQWCLKRNVKKFIMASSMNVYGQVAPGLPICEKTPVQPPSPYAVGKIASEYLCQIYQSLGINTTCLRLFNVYGPMQDMRNLKQGMVSIYMSYVAKNEPILVRGSKERFRDFVSVHDVVSAFMLCMQSKAAGKIYNIATGRKTFVGELLKMIIKSFEQDPAAYPIVQGEPTIQDQFGIYGDAALIQQDLGWKPQVTLEKGLNEMANWVKNENIVRDALVIT